MATQTDVVNVLLVDDDEDDYLITRDLLTGQDRASFAVDWCSEYEDALAAIREQRHDVYLIDYRLGAGTGLDLVREGFAAGLRAPVIMLTGQPDYEIDLEATALGITDYLLKQELDPAALERSIRYAVSQHRVIHELAEGQERYALAVRAANDGIWDWNLITDRIYYSPRWHAILGHPDASGDGTPSDWLHLVHFEDLPRLQAAIDAHLAGHTPHLESEHRIRHADGDWRWVLTRGLAIRGPGGEATRMAGSLSDITDRHAAEEQLQHDALHDALTGLPNRALFTDRLEQALQRTVRDPSLGCAVLFVDIDNFKLINDSLSHAIGDQLLIALAERLAGVLRPGDTVARLGGDEFTVLLESDDAEDGATSVAARLMLALRKPFEIEGNELFLTASIGISLGSSRSAPTELLRDADIAMYDAKRSGRGRCAVFDDSMHKRVVDRLTRENELRQALEQSLLHVHYQPIIDLATGRITSLEALVRWPLDWPEVPPLEFIPVAEDTGLVGVLGLQVLRAALRALAGWRRAGLLSDEVRVGVNVSARQFEDVRLVTGVRDALAEADLPGDALTLEITESTLLQEPQRVRAIVSELCTSGVGLHLDDFGTGYSSLEVLHQLPFDALKIDRSFVTSIDEDGSDVIVRSTVALAHSLGLGVIAEGIEQPGQLRRLRGLGCEYGQGFLFSPPLSAEDTQSLLESWSTMAALQLADHVSYR